MCGSELPYVRDDLDSDILAICSSNDDDVHSSQSDNDETSYYHSAKKNFYQFVELEISDTERYTCRIDNMVFSTESSMLRHLVKHHKDDLLDCILKDSKPSDVNINSNEIISSKSIQQNHLSDYEIALQIANDEYDRMHDSSSIYDNDDEVSDEVNGDSGNSSDNYSKYRMYDKKTKISDIIHFSNQQTKQNQTRHHTTTSDTSINKRKSNQESKQHSKHQLAKKRKSTDNKLLMEALKRNNIHVHISDSSVSSLTSQPNTATTKEIRRDIADKNNANNTSSTVDTVNFELKSYFHIVHNITKTLTSFYEREIIDTNRTNNCEMHGDTMCNDDIGDSNSCNSDVLISDVLIYLCNRHNIQLYDYQIKGIKWLCSLHYSGLNGILADAMGLG
jgi:hypothetical protein